MLIRLLAWLFGISVSQAFVIDATRPLLVVVRGGDEEQLREFGEVLGQYVENIVVLRADGADLQLLRLK